MTNRCQKLTSVLWVIVLLIVAVGVVAKAIFNTLDNVALRNTELRETPDPLKAELSNMITKTKNRELDFIDVSVATTFSWDRLFIFGDYTLPSEIDSVVGRSWRKNCHTRIDVSDGYTLLVFTEDNVVAHCLDYPKDKGYFLIPEQAYHEGLSAQEARFVLNEDGELTWIGSK